MIDGHCHPFVLERQALDLSAFSLDIGHDPEAEDRRRHLGPGRISQELLTVRLAARFGCDPGQVEEVRNRAAGDWQRYVSGLFAEAGITGLVMDPAWPAEAAERLDEYAALTGCSVHPILRIDPLIDRAIAEGDGAQEILRKVLDAMAEAAARGYVGFKTIVAYRTGLAVDPQASLEEADRSLRNDVPVRRRGKALRDLVLRKALGTAADLGRPVQIHTGIGDSEIRLAEADPLLLEELLRTPEGSAAAIVLIHGSFPWHEELAYLAASKPNVWADLSLFTLFSPLTTADRLLRILDLAPAARVLAGTDGYLQPELHWFGALVLADAWQEVERRMRTAGARSAWTEHLRAALFEENARSLYSI
jgi:predicted TIM-barrel fold metal-dependent hydrolase